MSKVAIFMANGCEEIEGLTVVDILRRAKIDIDMVSINDTVRVDGSHGIAFDADIAIKDFDRTAYDALIIPGGLPGTTNLGANDTVVEALKSQAADGKLVAAVCAAPSVLGDNGILDGKKATSYPGWEEHLVGAECLEDAVVRDGNIITSRGMGTAIAFALAIVEYLADKETADKISDGIIYSGVR